MPCSEFQAPSFPLNLFASNPIPQEILSLSISVNCSYSSAGWIVLWLVLDWSCQLDDLHEDGTVTHYVSWSLRYSGQLIHPQSPASWTRLVGSNSYYIANIWSLNILESSVFLLWLNRVRASVGSRLNFRDHDPRITSSLHLQPHNSKRLIVFYGNRNRSQSSFIRLPLGNIPQH